MLVFLQGSKVPKCVGVVEELFLAQMVPHSPVDIELVLRLYSVCVLTLQPNLLLDRIY